jgi:hypothetical protein
MRAIREIRGLSNRLGSPDSYSSTDPLVLNCDNAFAFRDHLRQKRRQHTDVTFTVLADVGVNRDRLMAAITVPGGLRCFIRWCRHWGHIT